MNKAQVELITWLIVAVPHKYLPPSIQKAEVALQCGSLDGLQEILEAYITGQEILGYQFETMTRQEVLEYAKKYYE